MKQIVVASLVLFSVSVAFAAPVLPELPRSQSLDSKQLYQALRVYKWDCPKDDEAAKRKLVTETVDGAAKITDEFDRGQWTTYATELQAWFDTYAAGIPDAGTWAELEKTFTKARKAFDAVPATAPTDVNGALELYTAARKQSAVIAAVQPKLDASPCKYYPGNWYELNSIGKDALERADRQMHAIIDPIVTAYQTWRDARAVLDAPVPSTYWEHFQQTAKLVELAAATEALAAQVTDLAAWRPALTGDDAKAADAAPAELAAALETVRARADKQLADLAMPPLKQDKKRTKLIQKLVANEDGKLVGIVVSPKGTSKESWSEEVEVSRDSSYAYYKTYKFVRERYSIYYAWKPAGATGDVCELWHQSYMRYKKGSPGTDKSWQPYQSWKEGYVSCANAGKVSKKKLKK